MALRPEDLIPEPNPLPWPNGFTYRPVEEVPDFQIRPERLAHMARRLRQFETYHHRPSDVEEAPTQFTKPQDWQPFLAELREALGIGPSQQEPTTQSVDIQSPIEGV